MRVKNQIWNSVVFFSFLLYFPFFFLACTQHKTPCPSGKLYLHVGEVFIYNPLIRLPFDLNNYKFCIGIKHIVYGVLFYKHAYAQLVIKMIYYYVGIRARLFCSFHTAHATTCDSSAHNIIIVYASIELLSIQTFRISCVSSPVSRKFEWKLLFLPGH